MHQTLYREIPAHRRHRLHRRIGEALEALTTGWSNHPADLVRHFRAAGDVQRAIHYGVQAGDLAAARFAHAEAVASYQEALDLLVGDSDSAHAAEVRHRLGDELYDLNRLPEAHLSRSMRLSLFLSDLATRAPKRWCIGV